MKNNDQNTGAPKMTDHQATIARFEARKALKAQRKLEKAAAAQQDLENAGLEQIAQAKAQFTTLEQRLDQEVKAPSMKTSINYMPNDQTFGGIPVTSSVTVQQYQFPQQQDSGAMKQPYIKRYTEDIKVPMDYSLGNKQKLMYDSVPTKIKQSPTKTFTKPFDERIVEEENYDQQDYNAAVNVDQNLTASRVRESRKLAPDQDYAQANGYKNTTSQQFGAASIRSSGNTPGQDSVRFEEQKMSSGTKGNSAYNSQVAKSNSIVGSQVKNSVVVQKQTANWYDEYNLKPVKSRAPDDDYEASLQQSRKQIPVVATTIQDFQAKTNTAQKSLQTKLSIKQVLVGGGSDKGPQMPGAKVNAAEGGLEDGILGFVQTAANTYAQTGDTTKALVAGGIGGLVGLLSEDSPGARNATGKVVQTGQLVAEVAQATLYTQGDELAPLQPMTPRKVGLIGKLVNAIVCKSPKKSPTKTITTSPEAKYKVATKVGTNAGADLKSPDYGFETVDDTTKVKVAGQAGIADFSDNS